MQNLSIVVFVSVCVGFGANVSAQNKSCAPKTHAKLPAVTGMTYHAARKSLLANGWQPFQTKPHNTAKDDPDIAYGNGQSFWSKGYVEVEACSGTGVAPCAFLFRMHTAIDFVSQRLEWRSPKRRHSLQLPAISLRVTDRRVATKSVTVLGRALVKAIALVLSLAMFKAYGQPSVPDDKVAKAVCVAPRNGAMNQTANAMCSGNLLQAFATVANQTFNLPKPLPIVGIECGQPNAYFDKSKVAIFVCYELAKEIFERASREIRAGGEAQLQIAAGALFFAFVHELGHAVIHLYNLPVLGREEDAADQIASLLLIVLADRKSEVAQYWTAGAHWFFRKRPLFFGRHHFADEHSVNPQRQFNIACWIYGSNPNKYLQFAQYAKLPANRAARCEGEYQQLTNAAQQMLSPYLKR